MNPKQKSEELVEKMDVIHKFKLNNGNVLPVSMHLSQQIGCAIIAVEEIIKQWEYIDTYLANGQGKLNPNLRYWMEVLTELKSMQ